MDKKTTLMYGSLLHDIGKIIYRSNDHAFARGTHSKLGYNFYLNFQNLKITKCSIVLLIIIIKNLQKLI